MAEASKSSAPSRGKSAPMSEEGAGTSHKGKGTGRREKAEESRGGRSGMRDQAMKSAARRKVKEEFVGGTEGESRMVLQTDGTTRCRVMGAGMVQSKGHCHIFEMPKMWQRKMLCRK